MRSIRFSRPKLYDKQYAAIYPVARYAVIEASTKAGKTVGCLVWLIEQAVKGRDGQNFWWVAPVFSQAKIAFRRAKRMIPRDCYEPNETEQKITLLTGAVIWFKGADKPDTLYGEDVYAAVIDEATRVKDEAWHAVRSTLTATKGHVRLIGNVKGRKNWAYKLARKAESGTPDMHYAKLTAYDAVEAGVLTIEEIEDAKRQLPENVFKELYLAEPSEDGGNPFGLDAIAKQINAQGLSPLKPHSWGWDLAKKHDYTVGIALDEFGDVCRLERWQTSWLDTERKIIEATGDCSAWVDSTGVGDPVLERLVKDRHQFHGYHFTSASKQQLMEGLAVAIQQSRIRYPAGHIVNELESFEYELTRTGVRYTAPEGLFDDCVCALALAVHGFTRAHPVMVPTSGLTRKSPWLR